jgi:hypothetical protein
MSNNVEALLEYFRGKPLKTWHIVLIADIISEKLAGKILIPPSVIKPPTQPTVKIETPKTLEPPKPQTQFIDLSNMSVSGSYELLNLIGRGTLNELAIVSPSRKFGIQIFSDNLTRIFKDFDELEQISQYVESIDAFEDNGSYILSVKDISWIDSFRLLLIAYEPIEFKRIFASYCTYKF